MSDQPTFSEAFVAWSHKRQIDKARNVSVRSIVPRRGKGWQYLVTVGGPQNRFVFADGGVQFQEGRKLAQYSWDELSLILPGDLSLADDQIRAFTNLDDLTRRFSRAAGCLLMLVGLAYLLSGLLYEIIMALFSAIGWAWSVGPYGYALICCLIPILIFLPILTVMGSLCALLKAFEVDSGVLAGVTGLFGSVTRPLVRLLLWNRFGDRANGLTVVKHSWVKEPWGISTADMRDLIVSGVKLRRAGFV